MKSLILISSLMLGHASFAYTCTGTIILKNGLPQSEQNPQVTSSEPGFSSDQLLDFSPDEMGDALNKKNPAEADQVPDTILAYFDTTAPGFKCDFDYAKLLQTKLVTNRVSFVTLDNQIHEDHSEANQAFEEWSRDTRHAGRNQLKNVYDKVVADREEDADESRFGFHLKLDQENSWRDFKTALKKIAKEDELRKIARAAVDQEDRSELSAI